MSSRALARTIPRDTAPALDTPRSIAPSRPTLAAELAAAAARLTDASTSTNTRRAYASDWRAWLAWTSAVEASPELPARPELALAWAVAMHEQGRAIATIRRRLAGLSAAHRERGLDTPSSPALERVLAGIVREQQQQPRGAGRKRALDATIVAAALPQLSTRDRAVLLVGLATGCRRSELAALEWGQIQPSTGGLVIVLGARKCGPAGQCVGVPRGAGLACPVAALRDLRREQGNPTTGPVFGCCGHTIAAIVKRAAEFVGEDGAAFSGHSLRAGMITTASGAGVSLASIMSQSGHASASIAATYCRHDAAGSNPAPLAVVQALARACEAFTSGAK